MAATIRSAITVSLVPEARGGPFVFWDGLAPACKRAAALGFDAVEIFPPGAQALSGAGAIAKEHGLAVAAVGTGGGWVRHRWHLCHADESVRSHAIQYIREIIDAAAALGAPAIIGSMQGRWDGAVDRERALDLLGEALAPLGEHARQAGQPLLYEPLNRYETNLLHTLRDTTQFLQEIGAANVLILGDLFHMNIEEADLAAAIHAAGPRLGHVHFADSNRRAIGFGHTAIAAVAQALKLIGYRGFVSAEVLPLPSADAAAEQTIRAFREHFPLV